MESTSGHTLGTSEPVILLDRVWVRACDFDAALQHAHAAKTEQSRTLFDHGNYKTCCITKIYYIGTGFIIMVFSVQIIFYFF